jgi:LmbE family N-acetylglucosaminyl deacetylase
LAGDPGQGRVVVVAPHPDDETLGVGGLLAELLGRGHHVTVVAVTDGEAAFRRGPEAGGRREGRVEGALAARRRGEQRRALRALAPGAGARASIVRLGVPDGAVAAVRDDVTAALRTLVSEASWCLAPLEWDGHPDHDAAGRAATEACAQTIPLHHYPIWAWHWASPHDMAWAGAFRVPLGPSARRRKSAALHAHRSQHEPPPGTDVAPILPAHVLARFRRPFEVLFDIAPKVPAS